MEVVMAEQGTANAEPTQETEGGAVAAPEAVEAQETRPDWLDPRFKTPEDQAKAYKEAETKMQRESQARATLERQNQELLARTQQVVSPKEPDTNYDELFWQKPTEVINTLLSRRVDEAVRPFIESSYEAQKSKYANDPDFKKYEHIVDQVMSIKPELKTKNGALDEIYRVARAMDPEYESRIVERVRNELQSKVIGSAEGSGSPGMPEETVQIRLNADEKRAAEKLYPDVPVQEAHKKYGEAKKRMGGA